MKLNRLFRTVAMSLAATVFSQLAVAAGALGPGGGALSAGQFTSSPPLVVSGADPFLMIDLSVERTQQAEAYTDGLQTYANGTVCPGRVPSGTSNATLQGIVNTPWGNQDIGICYTNAERYIGYFDSEKCYTYDAGDGLATWAQQATGPYPGNLQTPPNAALNPPHFKPSGAATNRTCSNAFSGNFLNWATMTALDEFRVAMTGGARLIDTSGSSAKTLLVRTRRFDDWNFVMKAISNAGNGLSYTNGSATGIFKNDPAKVTPFSLAAQPTTTSTSAYATCSCDGAECSSGSSASDGCRCSTQTSLSYVAGDKLYVVNDWSDISPNPGASLHRTRFYTFQTATTTKTVTKQAWRRGNLCGTTTGSPSSTSAFTAVPLTVGSVSDFNVIVKVCESNASGVPVPSGDEKSLCVTQTDGTNSYYKPEGLLQKNALKMSYGLASYTGRRGDAINGGVLRSNAKYIGDRKPSINGGLEDNPQKEISSSGLVVFDPENLTLARSGTAKAGVNSIQPINSGIINYINQFALFAGQYKYNDPDAELYYESLRYLMNLGPTSSFWSPPSENGGALSATTQDGFPIMGAGTAGSPAWTDPVASSCQKNFALYVGDKNPHRNNYLPGGYSLGGDDPACGSECSDALAKGIDAGALEDALGAVEGNISKSTNRGRNDGYGLAGMAWWANTHDIRTDKDGNQRLKTFIVDTQEYSTSSPVGKSNALWVAAKWGGFEESTKTNYDPADNNVVAASTALSATPQPDVQSEWNARGAVFNDGTRLPDTYTLASQPASLVSGLTQVFAAASSGSSSASAAAVVANNAYSVASVYQALYEPQLSNGGVGVGWTGLVRSFFVDDKAQVREDTDGNGALTDADYVINYKPDPSNNAVTVADLYAVNGSLVHSNIAIRDLKPVWNAGARLSALPGSAIQTQRSYNSSATAGRYIRTWVDTNNNGKVDAGEEIDFTEANFPGGVSNDSALDNARLLGLDSTNGNLASNIVNYIRGQEIAGLRNRTIDMSDGKGLQTRRLGDIVHSAPLVVGAPAQTYDVSFGDPTYAAFKTKYASRRQVVYVGANDGMLHAFNGGFFDPETKSYLSTDAQPLGGELWAYVPYNLLPHLRWLTDPLYQHTFYVDGTPQSFDVNIFADDADHPGGWGTILVVGFRMGGGEVTVNATTDQTSAADAGNRTLRPSYVVFDITNPENPPKLLAEINDQYMGHTVSQPAVVKRRVINNGVVSANQWYLAMGSGPIGDNAANSQIAHDKAVSFRPARAFLYDLNGTQPLYRTTAINAVTDAKSFVGDMAPMDWNKDFTDEVIYFGTVGNTDTADPKGNLWRMLMPSDYSIVPTFSMVLSGTNSGQPFSAPPLPTFDKYNRPWVFAGTGRFYTSNDVLSAKQMTYYGIRESSSNLTQQIAKSDLVNTTGIRVSSISDKVADSSNTSPVMVNGQSVSTFSQLTAAVEAASGWYINLTTPPARNIDRSLIYKNSLLFVEYRASNDSCSPAGSSRLFAPNLLTGTASPFVALEADPNVPRRSAWISGRARRSFPGCTRITCSSTRARAIS
jgi:type IV pilus assembly protein PilY1